MMVDNPESLPESVPLSLLAASRPCPLVLAPWAFMSHVSPTSLKFADKALERAYEHSTLSTSYLPLDWSICFHKLWISLVLVICICTGVMEATSGGKAVWCLYLCLLSGQLALMRLAPELYRENRKLLIVPLKVFLAATLTAFVPTFVLKEVHSTFAYLEVLLLGAGLVMQLCTGVCIPVFWRHHVPMALATFLTYNLVMLRPLADVFMCTTTSIDSTAALYAALDNSAYTIGGLLMPYPMGRPKAASPRAQVYIVVLWLQLQLALLAPCFYLYHVESRSRSDFLQRRQHDEQPCPRTEAGSSSGSSSSTIGQAPAAASNSSGGSSGAACRQLGGAESLEHMPGQPVVLGCAFYLLLALMSWNLLHLCMNWMLPVLDSIWPHAVVARLASQHGMAGRCFQQPGLQVA